MKLGLIGANLSYSFSKNYFEDKFKNEKLSSFSYGLFELTNINQIQDLINEEELDGFNVTIPYKESILSFLDELDESAQEIGAVNTVKLISKRGDKILKGYNTDTYGFAQSIKPFLKNTHERALILGTGGASKAVNFVLKNLGIDTNFVSRTPENNQLSYSDINEYVLKHHKLIINCTPLGTYPEVDTFPNLPYKLINDSHMMMDMVYNPETTEFMKKGKKEGAVTINGLSMLHHQAEKAWEIWSK
mgnify:CR=1 FL=1